VGEGLSGGVNPLALLNVVVLAVATFLCWSFWSGKRTIPLYALALTALVGLLLASLCQLLNISVLVEPANALAIGFSFAGCAAGPSLWRDEMRKDLEKAPRLYAPLTTQDLRSWQGMLKLVERMGALKAALVYLAPWVVGLAVLELTLRPSGPLFDRTFVWVAHAPIAAFALLSAWYLYRASRRLVPGA
jgi:hypothetical protein